MLTLCLGLASFPALGRPRPLTQNRSVRGQVAAGPGDPQVAGCQRGRIAGGMHASYKGRPGGAALRRLPGFPQ